MENCNLDLIKIILQLMMASTPLVLAAIGEMITEKSGVLNLGVEGMMIMGAIGGFALAVQTGNPFLGALAGGIAGMLLSMIFAFFTQILLTNQVATGLALTLFGVGLSALLGDPYKGVQPPLSAKMDFIDALKDITILGGLFILISFALVVYTQYFLTRTRRGLVLRAVGENHNAAHAIGYNVIAVRFAAIGFGGFFAGLGGAALSLWRVPQWTEGMTAGMGWIALALVVFGAWRPWLVLLGAYVFGGINVLQLNLQVCGVGVKAEYLSMLPYIMTIIALVILSRRATSQAAPASLGKIFQPTD